MINANLTSLVTAKLVTRTIDKYLNLPTPIQEHIKILLKESKNVKLGKYEREKFIFQIEEIIFGV